MTYHRSSLTIALLLGLCLAFAGCGSSGGGPVGLGNEDGGPDNEDGGGGEPQPGTGSDATLESLRLSSSGRLVPPFDPEIEAYTLDVGFFAAVTLTPTAADADATITVNGDAVSSGLPSAFLDLAPGPNLVAVDVLSADGSAARTYTVTITRAPSGAEEAILQSSNIRSDDMFGSDVAISGDTLVVGAVREDSSATGVNGDGSDNSDGTFNRGAAYVFTRTSSGWIEEAYLKASNTGTGDYFGASVAIDGDTLVVGAFGEDSSATGIDGNQTDNGAEDSGAVYVFTRSNGTWSQQAYIKASNTGAGDRFGGAVAISGDTLVVGAFQEDSSAQGVNGTQADDTALDSGAVYVFTRTGGTWTQQAYLKAANTGEGDAFGEAVAIHGDTLVVGARGEDGSTTGVNGDPLDDAAEDSGAAYVFARVAGIWSQQAYLKASNTEADDEFGGAVSISGDTLVVGAMLEDGSATGVGGDPSDNDASSAGAAYVFARTAGTWSLEAYVKASNTTRNDWFGSSVAICGDVLLVGASSEDNSGANDGELDDLELHSGAAYVFLREAGAWRPDAYLKGSDTDSRDNYGAAVATSGDTLVVGARDVGLRRGSVYIVR